MMNNLQLFEKQLQKLPHTEMDFLEQKIEQMFSKKTRNKFYTPRNETYSIRFLPSPILDETFVPIFDHQNLIRQQEFKRQEQMEDLFKYLAKLRKNLNLKL